jgi:ABC-type bacteriocin/lantibiotic exporter with double-glycine peptidase domain
MNDECILNYEKRMRKNKIHIVVDFFALFMLIISVILFLLKSQLCWVFLIAILLILVLNDKLNKYTGRKL